MPSSKTKVVLYLLISVSIAYSQAKAATRFQETHEPRLTIQPTGGVQNVKAGEGISEDMILCKAEGDRPEAFSQLRWHGPNDENNFHDLMRKHYVSEPWSGAVSLRFKNPSQEDSGIYYCRGEHQGVALKKEIRVKVYNPLKIENCPTPQKIVAGRENERINCRIIADSPEIILSKNGKAISKNDTRYKWNNEDAIVVTAPADRNLDAGSYSIIIYYSTIGSYREVIIDVHVHTTPSIKPVSEHFGTEGEQKILKCEVSGNPQPLVYWTSPRLKNLTSEGGYHVNPVAGTLLIEKVRKFDDDGDFECKAVNDVDTVTQKVPMRVYMKPEITAFENRTVSEGEDAILECRATGFPEPKFSIRKAGNNQHPYLIGINNTKDISTKIEEAGKNVYIYTVRLGATRDYFGLHYCNATNQVGSVERVGKLQVNFKPDLSQTPTKQFHKLGMSPTITCHVKAFPAPEIKLYQNGIQILDVKVNVKPSLDGNVHIATISPKNTQNPTDEFTCRAENIMGHAEQRVASRYTTKPGRVEAIIIASFPTAVKIRLIVPDDGGDRIRRFIYTAKGITMDEHNPTYRYQPDYRNDTVIDASPSVSDYMIRNLFPYFRYKFQIMAENGEGTGDRNEFDAWTSKPTAPDRPTIINPSASQNTIFVSEYQNGFPLKWTPPDLDNGGSIISYQIKVYRYHDAQIMPESILDKKVGQMSERPLIAKLGPLEVNQRYRVQIQAENQYGLSEPASLGIETRADRPPMPEFEATTLAWLIEPSTFTLIGLLSLAVVLLIIIDLTFCVWKQMGLIFWIKSSCCPAKPDSVISDQMKVL